jgi:hypothetical protein
MNQPTSAAAALSLGDPVPGGFFGGLINILGQVHGIAVAGKSQGEFKGAWLTRREDVPGAVSCFDSVANTIAMAAAGSELAQRILALNIDGVTGFSLPSRDVLEVLYRNLKPSTEENYCTFRDGDNPSAVPPTYPYTAAAPAQTVAQDFRKGGVHAFDEDWYWSSTQFSPFTAWIQDFANGDQGYGDKDCSYRARAVRIFTL